MTFVKLIEVVGFSQPDEAGQRTEFFTIRIPTRPGRATALISSFPSFPLLVLLKCPRVWNPYRRQRRKQRAINLEKAAGTANHASSLFIGEKLLDFAVRSSIHQHFQTFHFE